VRLLQSCEKLPSESLNVVLRVFTNCGTCCCMPFKAVGKAFSMMIKTSHHKTRSLLFGLFEKTLYLHLGAYRSVGSRVSCAVCAELWATGWERLVFFKELMTRSDGRLSQSVVCHLARTVPLLRDQVKQIILFKVFLPAFLECKIAFLKNKLETQEFVISSCLSVFTNLINEGTVGEFINLGGVNHLLDIIRLPNFSKYCCSVLEKTILCEWSISSKVTALELLKIAADSATSAFFRAIGVEGVKKRAMGMKRNRPSTTEIPITAPTTEMIMELLQNVAVFWRSYAVLSISHSTFSKIFARSAGENESNVLLGVVLNCITQSSSGM